MSGPPFSHWTLYPFGELLAENLAWLAAPPAITWEARPLPWGLARMQVESS